MENKTIEVEVTRRDEVQAIVQGLSLAEAIDYRNWWQSLADNELPRASIVGKRLARLDANLYMELLEQHISAIEEEQEKALRLTESLAVIERTRKCATENINLTSTLTIAEILRLMDGEVTRELSHLHNKS